MKNKNNSISRSNRTAAASVLVVVLILGIFAALYFYAHDAEENTIKPTEYAEYEKGRVVEILMDNCEVSEVAENAYRGDQKLLVKVTSGQYKGETMLVSGFVGPIYGEPAKVGQSVVLSINTYANGDHTATVYEYNRTPIVFLILGIFVLVTIAVGGRTGAKSVLGLILTMVVILMSSRAGMQLSHRRRSLPHSCFVRWLRSCASSFWADAAKKSSARASARSAASRFPCSSAS